MVFKKSKKEEKPVQEQIDPAVNWLIQRGWTVGTSLEINYSSFRPSSYSKKYLARKKGLLYKYPFNDDAPLVEFFPLEAAVKQQVSIECEQE